MESYGNKAVDVHFYKLKTVNIIRKYISFLDLSYTYFKHYITKKPSPALLPTPLAKKRMSSQLHSLARSRPQAIKERNRNKNKQTTPSLPLALQIPHTLLFVSSPDGFFKSRAAMKCHASQLVWFRYLYVLFSRYMLINELERVR